MYREGRGKISCPAQVFHESRDAPVDLAVLHATLGCSFGFASRDLPRDRQDTVQVRIGTNTLRLPGGTPILFALGPLRSGPTSLGRIRGYALSQQYFMRYLG